jgi:hypothetical protein
MLREFAKSKAIQVEEALFFTTGYGLVEPDVVRIGEESGLLFLWMMKMEI